MQNLDAMNPIISKNRTTLEALCRKYKVARLDVFGSATRDENPQPPRDVDFLVTFEACAPSEHYDRYFGLLEDLEALMDRKVDLVETSALKNPYFVQSIEQSRQQVYAA